MEVGVDKISVRARVDKHSDGDMVDEAVEKPSVMKQGASGRVGGVEW